MQEDIDSIVVKLEDEKISNPFLDVSIVEKIEDIDAIIVPFPWGEQQEPHIDVEMVPIIKKGQISGKHIIFSLTENEIPKIRDQRSADIDFGTILFRSIPFIIWLLKEIILFVKDRKQKLKQKSTTIKIQLLQLVNKDGYLFNKFVFEGSDESFSSFINQMKSLSENQK